jgi:prepilin-type N-terminal cleavage/methylation domain-containing protein
MRQQRKGFTLIEMMVSVALVLLIMVILSQAFATALESFRLLKGIGDMEQRLRSTTLILRSDLAAPHFEGTKKLSTSPFLPNFPPQQGFFRIYQGGPSITEGVDGDGIASLYAPGHVQGGTSANHILHFTVRRDGNQRRNYFFADVSQEQTYNWPSMVNPPPPDQRYQDPGTYTSQWIEVAYFLRTNGANANGTPLFTLYRRQRLATPSVNSSTLNSAAIPASRLTDLTDPNNPGLHPALAYTDISGEPNPGNAGSIIYFNSPEDLTIPQNRFSMNPAQYGGLALRSDGVADGTYSILADSTLLGGQKVHLYAPFAGADALLTDVISFDVQIYYAITGGGTSGDFVDVPYSPGPSPGNFPANPIYANPAAGPWVFDTWSNAKEVGPGGAVVYDYSKWNGGGRPHAIMPLSTISIQAIRVIIRIWDQRTQQARQVTVIQDM